MTEQCKRAAAYRYTWPGKDESYVCEVHSDYLRTVANAIGLHCQLIPIQDGAEDAVERCRQQVKEQLLDSKGGS